MSKKSRRSTRKLEIEVLEDRTVPAGTLPWPIAGNANFALGTLYGQFMNFAPGPANMPAGAAPNSVAMIMHAGIDIAVAAGTPVRAIQAGNGVTVAGVRPFAQAGTSATVSVVQAGANGFNYTHIMPAINPGANPRRVWLAGEGIGDIQGSFCF